MKKFIFLIPVYNDWKSLKILLEKIELQLKGLEDEFSIIILNDFSTLKCDISVNNFKKIKHLKIINFNKNVGSQRAIAIGLKYISQTNQDNEKKMIIIMDSDGQDDPEILNNIIEINKKFPNEIITITDASVDTNQSDSITTWNWNLVTTGVVPFIIFVIAGTAELNRPPFDLVEAEQEIGLVLE